MAKPDGIPDRDQDELQGQFDLIAALIVAIALTFAAVILVIRG